MKRALGIIGLVIVLAAAIIVIHAQINPINLIRKPLRAQVNIITNDSISLSTTVFVPRGKKKFPAMLVRTPYNKVAEEWMGRVFGIYGIAVVIQDVRGKYESQGEYYPFIHEREDGLKTLRWIKAQSWSNGTVAGWGGSYVGYTQWAISDSLDYVVPLLTGANIYDFLYPNGIFSLQSAFDWGLKNASSRLNDIPADRITTSFSHLPLSTADDSVLRDIPYINDWLVHENYDNYWNSMNFRGISKASVLSIAGWYDIFLKAQIEDFLELSGNGNSDNRMIIGPWCHGSQSEVNTYGGEKNTGSPRKIMSYMVKIIKGRSHPLPSPLKDNIFNLYIMERNEYFGSDVWPPRETRIVPYYFGPGGTLGVEPYPSPGRFSYTYDPLDPYHSFGGTALGEKIGPARQNSNISRTDQVVFEMPVSGKPVVLLGPVSAVLWISSDVKTTDFYVCLQDVFPDGKIINIQEGGAKVRLEGNKPEKKDISVWSTGYQVNPSHKIRVTISSSWFPRFNRNLNDGLPIAVAANPVVANQTIYYGPEMPSAINLPVLSIK
jgi:putative CocE/NonD family hydrolase